MHFQLKSKTALWAGPGALALIAAASACSAKVSSTDDLGVGARAGAAANGGSGGSSGSFSTGAVGGTQGGGPSISLGGSSGAGSGGGAADNGGAAGDGALCATVATTAKLETVYLVFAFDVSASMGNLGELWYDPALKWDPAVEATRGFFEDEASAGLFASLTAFPVNAEGDGDCPSDPYVAPLVSMTELPSTRFGEALDAIRAEEWRGGTPTRGALDGVMSFITSYRDDHPGRYAIVLVTDGYPQGCGETNTLGAIEDLVSSYVDDAPTYVIGVKNPPLTDAEGTLAPDTVSDLNGVAEAGGTDSAFIIDTGDPSKTRADFRKAVDVIRGASIACSLDVPAPPDGRRFLKDHVVVSATEGDETTDLTYDEDCKEDGAWHYDSPTTPSEVVLCPTTCTRLQNASEAKLQVGFTCQPAFTIR